MKYFYSSKTENEKNVHINLKCTSSTFVYFVHHHIILISLLGNNLIFFVKSCKDGLLSGLLVCM